MAFLNLRDENDRPDEVKLSKLKTCPFFNKSDIARFPKESGDRIVNQQMARYEEGETFSGRGLSSKEGNANTGNLFIFIFLQSQ